MNDASASAVGYEVATCHNHFHDTIGFVHGSNIICDIILENLNGISVANLYPIPGKVAVHLIAWHHGGLVAMLFYVRTCKESLFHEFNETLQDTEA